MAVKLSLRHSRRARQFETEELIGDWTALPQPVHVKLASKMRIAIGE